MKNSIFKFSCPVCKADSFEILYPYSSITNTFKNRELVKCSQCDLVSMYPILIDFDPGNYYAKEYWNDEILKKRSPALLQQAVSRCQFIKSGVSFGNKLRVLDIGAGIGYMNWGFRTVWPDALIEYTAIEVNPAAVKYLHSDPGVNHVKESLDDVHAKYDVIILSHILEHISTPYPFLDKIIKYQINKTGCLYIEVPNQDYRFKKRNEPHVIFYSPDSLSKLLTIKQLKIMKLDTCGEPVWKKRAESGIEEWKFLLSLKNFVYRFQSSFKSEFNMYGGDRQWIRAVCKLSE